MLQRRARRPKTPPHIDRIARHTGEPPRLTGQRLRGTPGHQPRHERRRRESLRAGDHQRIRALGRGLLQDHVRVGPGDAEGGDSGPARMVVGLPLPPLGQQPDLSGGPVHVLSRLVHVKGGGQDARP